MTSPLSPSARWATLKISILEQINAIDADTPWQETEPRWWLEMANVRRDLLNPDQSHHAPANPEVARVLEAVSLWLTEEGRFLAQSEDDIEPPELYTPSLEALIADVEGLRAALGVAS